MSVYHEAPTVERTSTPAGDEICHAVCACMVDAAPRIALCGYDCTDAAEGDGTICVVCADIVKRYEPCRFCGGLD